LNYPSESHFWSSPGYLGTALLIPDLSIWASSTCGWDSRGDELQLSPGSESFSRGLEWVVSRGPFQAPVNLWVQCSTTEYPAGWFPAVSTVSAVGTAMKKTSRILGGCAQLWHHKMKSISISSLANGGDCVEKQCFVAENLLYQIVLLCSLYLLQFPWKWIGCITSRATYVDILCPGLATKSMEMALP